MTRLLAILVVVGCSSRAQPMKPSPTDHAPWSTSGVDWSTPPKILELAFVPPRIEELTLKNGVRILLVENHRLPVVSITAIHSAAGSREDGAKPGTAALVADLLDEQAGGRDKGALARVLDQTGARLNINIATDYASTQLVALTDHLPTSLAVFADVIQRPKLFGGDLQRVREERLDELRQRLDRSRTVGAQVFDRVVFGDHPYAQPAEGTVASVQQVTLRDVTAFWQRAYRPETITLVVAGDLTREAAQRMFETTFGAWANPHPLPSNSGAPPPPLAPYARQLAYVDTPGAAQSIVLVGRRTKGTGDPDQIAAAVANSILGGGATSRLDRKLHEELGVTFGAGSSFWRGRWAGTWAVATTFGTAVAADSLRTTLAMIETARTGEPTAEELARAKANLVRAVGLSFETTTGSVRTIERLVTQALPLDWYATYAARVTAITSPAAGAAIATAWSDLSIVVVGDWSKLGPSLRKLGLPVVQYGSDGTPVK